MRLRPAEAFGEGGIIGIGRRDDGEERAHLELGHILEGEEAFALLGPRLWPRDTSRVSRP